MHPLQIAATNALVFVASVFAALFVVQQILIYLGTGPLGWAAVVAAFVAPVVLFLAVVYAHPAD